MAGWVVGVAMQISSPARSPACAVDQAAVALHSPSAIVLQRQHQTGQRRTDAEHQPVGRDSISVV